MVAVFAVCVSGVCGIKAQAAETKAVNVGNKICPVMGTKINEKTKMTCEYKGKIYNFCCAMCPPVFKSNPEKYSKIAEEQAKGVNK